MAKDDKAASGVNPAQIASFLSSRARRIAAAPTEVQGKATQRLIEQTPGACVAEKAKRGARILGKYMSADEVAGMSERQKLAAAEAFTGRAGRNILSAEDLTFIRAGAGGGNEVVYNPMGNVQPVRGMVEAERFRAPKPVSASPQRPKREPSNIAGKMGKISIQPAKMTMTVDPLERLQQRMAGRTHGGSLAGLKPGSLLTRKV